jgi:hypothetical protein
MALAVRPSTRISSTFIPEVSGIPAGGAAQTLGDNTSGRAKPANDTAQPFRNARRFITAFSGSSGLARCEDEPSLYRQDIAPRRIFQVAARGAQGFFDLDA